MMLHGEKNNDEFYGGWLAKKKIFWALVVIFSILYTYYTSSSDVQ